ncbi:MAG: NUDIX domain-containing protein [Ilumatobacteraceae bacterium]
MSGTPGHHAASGADTGAELVDVVDDDDRVVATVTRREMRSRRLRHRAVFIIVTSSTGELLVHRRSEHKDLWPGRWDIGVGGVVGAGESYEAAGERELAEEVGVVGVVPAYVADGRYADADVDLVARAFRVVHDGPFRFADGEVVEARWVDAAGLVDLIATESFVPDSLTLLPIEVLFPVRFPFPAPGDPQGR